MKRNIIYSLLSFHCVRTGAFNNIFTRQFHKTPRLYKKREIVTMKKQKDPYQHIDYEFCKAKNEKQQTYINALNQEETKILFAIGPAGTGKTLIACNHAMKLLLGASIQRVIITRPIVPVEEEEHGFLPGNINKKMDPWLRPIFDIFLEKYSRTHLDRMMFDNIIEIAPLGFMRGRTFKNTLIIADEMQNSTPNQMKMLLTRIGENSKLIVTGDIKQTDISPEKVSGLSDIIHKTKRYFIFMKNKYGSHKDQSVQIIEFGNKDIERSKVVRKILDIYNIDNMVPKNEKDNTKNHPDNYIKRVYRRQPEEEADYEGQPNFD